MSVTGVRRPGVVTFIGVLIYIHAFLSLVAGLALLAFRNDADVLSATGATSNELVVSAIAELIVATLLFVVGVGVMRGARGVRLFVAVVEGLRMGVAMWLMFWHHSGAYLFSAVITVAIGLFVLWALYGNERSDAFFEST